ncbi:MAG: glutaredoxin family protein [Nitrospinae bacterium]|nr:glutaredoxin family protein [Nitrospinota bacterium]
MSLINFYTTSWCPDCVAAKRTLEALGIPYNEIDIDANPDATDLIVAARGRRVIPTLEYRGRFMDGNRFDRERFEKELKELMTP